MQKLKDFLISEQAVITVILLNTVALFFMASTGKDHPLRNGFFWLDYGCVVYFILEALLKIGTRGFRGYWSSVWNRFDFVIVLLSLPVLLEPLHLMQTDQFAVLLVLRLGRLFRLFKAMRFIPNREHLINGVNRALRASVGVFLALMIVNVIFAIGAAMLFREESPEYFGNPALATYSMFKIFTVEGWYEIPDAIAAGTGSATMAVVARVFFVFAVMVGGIIGLSLANAVFVDEMTMDNTADLETKVDQLLHELKGIKTQLDTLQNRE